MSSAYYSPGVTVTETVTPALTAVTLNPAIIAIVGEASGEQSATESLTLAGTTAVTLGHTGVEADSVVVYAFDGQLVGGGCYSVIESSDPDSVDNSGDETYTIARVASPSGEPTLAVSGSSGTLTGVYAYAVSFINAGGETGIGPASAPITVSAQGVDLSGIPTGASGTTARNIYRIKTSGANADNTYHLVATISDNVTTTLTDETTSDTTANAQATPPAGIASGDTVLVTYDYADTTYYQPTSISDFGSFTAKYGSPYDANGNISSALSFAARLAFLNGATTIVGVAAKSSSQVDIQNALLQLANDPTIRIVVVADGSALTLSSLNAHVTSMNNAGNYRIGIAGYDGSTSATAPSTLRLAAQAVNYEAIRLVAPSSFQMQNPVTSKSFNVGGQYAAAAIAGMYAARDVEIPLTRKSVAGFTAVNDLHSASDQILDAQAGLLVINVLGGVLQIRHDLTTAVGSVSTRESSVVRAKYEMASQLKSALDSSIVGLVATPARATQAVVSVITGVLEALVIDQIIGSYQNVSAQVSNSDPTTIQAQFEYDPSWPINNIVVNFSINTATGDFSLT